MEEKKFKISHAENSAGDGVYSVVGNSLIVDGEWGVEVDS